MHRFLPLLTLPLFLSLQLGLSGPSGPSRSSDQDLQDSLRQLSSAEGEVRREAERWLAANLTPGDAPLVEEVARLGDAEVRRRLGRALGLADQSLILSTTFLVDGDPVLAEIGERALTRLITRWSEHAWRAGLHEKPLRTRTRRFSVESRPQILRVPIVGDLGETVMLLAERGRLPLGLTVEPSLANRLPERGVTEVQGTWDEVVQRVASIYRVGLDGHGFGYGLGPGTGWLNGPIFLRFCAQTDAGSPATEIVLRWCRTLAAGVDPGMRVGAARALSSSGWPSAMTWMAERARGFGDVAALEGVLLAAVGGRVAPWLQSPEVFQRLQATAVAEFESGDGEGRGRRILMALRSMQPLGPSGQDLMATVLAGWQGAGATDRWVRLYLLDKMRSSAGRAPAREVLGDAAAPVFLRRQAVSTWFSASAGREVEAGPSFPRAEDVLRTPSSAAEAIALARLLAHGRFEFPSTWLEPGALPETLGVGGRGCVLAWLVLVPAAEGDSPAGPGFGGDRARVVGEHWIALLRGAGDRSAGSGQPVAELLHELGVEQEPALTHAWEWAHKAPQVRADAALSRALDRSLLLADILPRPRALALHGSLGDSPGIGGGGRAPGFVPDLEPDLAIVGTVGGWGSAPVAVRARQQLLGLLRLAFSADEKPDQVRPLLAALERVLLGLRRHGWEAPREPGEGRRRSPAELWSRDVSRLATRRNRSGLSTHFEALWPPAPPGAVRDLGSLSGLPSELSERR